MRIPNVQDAIVARDKVTGYLLSRSNPRSQNKAAYFEGLGFDIARWRDLADALQAHALHHEISDQDDTIFGTWYTVEGEIDTPTGKRPAIRSVWFVDAGGYVPRFVTAYPLPRRKQ